MSSRTTGRRFSLGHARSLGAGAYALELDITDPASAAGLIERLPEDLRAIDILVACAGHDIGGRQRFDLGRVEDWAGIVETNVTGVIRVCHAVVPGMLARGRGHVVTLGSTAGLKIYPGGTIYNAAKFAVRAFTEALRADYRDTDLRITLHRRRYGGIPRTGHALEGAAPSTQAGYRPSIQVREYHHRVRGHQRHAPPHG